MRLFKVGDIVARKSYGRDVSFKIIDVRQGADGNPVYVLRGLLHRIEADSNGNDLIKQDPLGAYLKMSRSIAPAMLHSYRISSYNQRYRLRGLRIKTGKILHVDSSRELMDKCIEHYRNAGADVTTRWASESEQPGMIRQWLRQVNPDILVVTGHDGMKKDTGDADSLSNYRTSRFFVESVNEARRYEPDLDRLCIFAGACQSYYEAIMGAGANFASSPGRVVINGLDPAIVSERVALTDTSRIVTPQEVARLTISGSKGIWGINTKGHANR